MGFLQANSALWRGDLDAVTSDEPLDTDLAGASHTGVRPGGKPLLRRWVWAGAGILALLVLGLAGLAWYHAKSRAGSESDFVPSGKPFTKTVVLTRATNRWSGAANEVQDVGVWTDTTLGPGEALLALMRRPDGSLGKPYSLLFVSCTQDGVGTSTSLSWSFGNSSTPGFGESEAEAAVTQLRKNISDKPLTLTAGEPLELFMVTNHFGGVVVGYVKYPSFRPQTA